MINRALARIRERPKQSWGIGLAAVAMAIVFLQLSTPGGSAADADEPEQRSPIPVQTVSVRPAQSLIYTQSFPARITPRRSSELSFDAQGVIDDVRVAEGASVREGEILAILESSVSEARLEQMRARAIAQDALVRAIEAELLEVRLMTERRRALHEKGLISKEEFDAAASAESSKIARLEAAGAELLAVQAAVKTAAAELVLRQIRSPYDGIVTRRYQDEGVAVRPGQPVLTIIENADPELFVTLPRAVIDDLHFEQPYTIRRQGVLETWQATLTAVIPRVEAESTGVTVVFAVHGYDALIAGDLVYLELKQRQDMRGFWVDLSALTEGPRGLWRVYLTDHDSGSLASTRSELVQIVHTDGDRAFVTGNLQSGDRVVVKGAHRVVPGQSVTVMQASDNDF